MLWCRGGVSVVNVVMSSSPMQPRQTVLTAAGSIGQASGDLLRHMGEGETDERFQVGLHFTHCFYSSASKQENTHVPSSCLKLHTHLCNGIRLCFL